MALAPFFDRIYTATGRHLSVTREALQTKLANILVGIDSEAADNQNDQWIAEMAVNLFARLYPRLSIRAQPAFASALTAIAQSINPLIEIVTDTPMATIVVGKKNEPNGIFARADGWVASTTSDRDVSPPGPSNVLAAGAAAAISVSEVFRRVFVGRSAE